MVCFDWLYFNFCLSLTPARNQPSKTEKTLGEILKERIDWDQEMFEETEDVNELLSKLRSQEEQIYRMQQETERLEKLLQEKDDELLNLKKAN